MDTVPFIGAAEEGNKNGVELKNKQPIIYYWTGNSMGGCCRFALKKFFAKILNRGNQEGSIAQSCRLDENHLQPFEYKKQFGEAFKYSPTLFIGFREFNENSGF